MVLTGAFGQFADPLDWIARQFGLDVKVDRTQLAESLSLLRGESPRPAAEALGSDKRTRFRLDLFGRCEGKLVALCGFSLPPGRLSMRQIEELSVDMVVLNGARVLGVQATAGKSAGMDEGIANEAPLLRLLPLNVFNRSYFQPKLDLIERDRKLKIADLGEAVVVTLAKPWLFYDVPRSARSRKKPPELLPF